MRTTFLLVGLVLGLVTACGRGSTGGEAIAPEPSAPPSGTAAAVEPPAPSAEPAAEPAGPAAEGDGYALAAITAGPYTAGEAGTFAVAIEAKDRWHLNEEYPTRVEVSGADGLAFPSATLSKADAAEFGETKARFDVPFRATAAGEHEVSAKVFFAICTPETCIPTERTLALRLPVE